MSDGLNVEMKDNRCWAIKDPTAHFSVMVHQPIIKTFHNQKLARCIALLGIGHGIA